MAVVTFGRLGLATQPKCRKCLTHPQPRLLPLVELLLGQETELHSLRLVNSWFLCHVFSVRGRCGRRRCVFTQIQVGECKLQPDMLLQGPLSLWSACRLRKMGLLARSQYELSPGSVLTAEGTD